ncbi:hypothetical protein [Photobacterium angustum]|uniref:hypothetical protein n=1 Tax=Photobacterium angustum TaxID=661 RepID=UPI0012D40D90|nr:hypothetical protein [Photobacterium angustum]
MKKEHDNDAPSKSEAPKESTLKFFVETKTKTKFIKQANREGLKLRDWCIKHLSAACDD